jgi:hypothetical protein
MQYVPEDAVYVYFRYNEQETVMVVMNCNDSTKEIKLDRFKERNSKVKSYVDIIQKKETTPADNTLKLEAYETKVLELRF